MQMPAKPLLVDAGFGYQAVLQGKERYGTIHRARINIYIAYFLGQILGHRAFATRGVAVYGNRYQFHRTFIV
jgi:hypothetical protein